MIALQEGFNLVKSFGGIDRFRRVGLCAALCVAVLLLPQRHAAGQFPLSGSIHGNVAVVVAKAESVAAVVHPGRTGIGAGSTIYVPNIQVTARNINTNATSAPVVTNADGYFRTPDLPSGQYVVCVSAPGFVASCLDRTIDVFRAVVTLGDVVPIRPATNAVLGTATLADHQTPCFFFRPSFSHLALTAKASLLGAGGKLLAGPINGNSSGQYVLPVPAAGNGSNTLRVTCDASVSDAAVNVLQPFTVQDVTIAASVPRILAFDFTKAGVGIRRADPGDTVTVSVLADDPDGNPLHYSWVDDSGRAVSLPDAPSVQWPLLNANSLNTLIVYVSNGKGGIAAYSRPMQSGPNENFFSGHIFNRQTKAGVAGAVAPLDPTATLAARVRGVRYLSRQRTLGP